MFFRNVFRSASVVACALVFSACAFAASGEVFGFGGGATLDDGGGSHATFGGGGGIRVGGRSLIFGEFQYIPITSQTATSGTTTATVSAHFSNYGGGIDYSFKDASSNSRVVPYVVGALGLARASLTANVNGAKSSAGLTDAFYVALGGGVRLYAGKNWGFKPEFRYLHFSSSLGSGNAYSYTGGIFWQFGK